MNGFVTILGAGPGDPELITVKGQQRLQSCDVVVYDYLIPDALLSSVKSGCRKIYVGKRAGVHSATQEEINCMLISLAKKGHKVVRLKGGDPFVFGRGGEEAIALAKEGVSYEIIPGVSSAIAVPECAGIPVTHRGISRSFHVIAGHTGGEKGGLPVEFDCLAGLSGTLVFLMGVSSLPMIVDCLYEAGRPGCLPIAVIENGTMPQQRVVRGCLEDIVEKVEEERLQTPAVIIAGDVASMDLSGDKSIHQEEKELQPGGKQPLTGILVGITGTSYFRERLGTLLEHMGAEIECFGSLEVVPFVKGKDMQLVYRNLDQYTMAVFTSANAVRLFFQGLLDAEVDVQSMGHMKLSVIGKGTADELKRLGFVGDLMPQTYNAGELALRIVKEARPGERVLIPRAKGGTPELAEILRQSSVVFEECILYEVIGRPEAYKDTRGRKPDYVTFASASGVEAFFKRMGTAALEELRETRIVCIGNATAKALRNHGRKVDIMAKECTVIGMADAILCDRTGDNK